MLAISKDTTSVGVVNASVSIIEATEDFLDTIGGPDVVFDSLLCAPYVDFGHVDFRCGA